MRVLLTGAFGNLGAATLRELLRQGHQVRCFDVKNRGTEKLARELRREADVVWGDIRDGAHVSAAVAEQEAIIHNAAILPPASEQHPALARAVNVDGTRTLLAAAEARAHPPRFIFTSSVSVFGPVQDREPPRRAHEPVRPTDHYTQHKVECEAHVQAARLPWLIMRVGVAIDPGARAGDPAALRMLFDTSPDNRMEYVHPRDVARAQVNALGCAEAWGKVLLIGGGRSCQIRQRDLFEALGDALGLGKLPAEAFGQRSYYTDWMDTEESQRLLRYQHYSFADYRRDSRRRMRHLRRVLWPIRPLVRRYLLGHSVAWSERARSRTVA
jgi:nucleoside-diphosphate-sugar epimerase